MFSEVRFNAGLRIISSGNIRNFLASVAKMRNKASLKQKINLILLSKPVVCFLQISSCPMAATSAPSAAAVAAESGQEVSLPAFDFDEKSVVAEALKGVSSDRSFAESMVASDPLAALRDEYLFPPTEQGAVHRKEGAPAVYLCGNSLGLQPKAVRTEVNAELDKWAQFGVEGHFKSDLPWVTVDETVHEASARIVGALPSEVAIMNSLTTNLHLLMVPFYRPTPQRHKIIIEGKAFPSDYVSPLAPLCPHPRCTCTLRSMLLKVRLNSTAWIPPRRSSKSCPQATRPRRTRTTPPLHRS